MINIFCSTSSAVYLVKYYTSIVYSYQPKSQKNVVEDHILLLRLYLNNKTIFSFMSKVEVFNNMLA